MDDDDDETVVALSIFVAPVPSGGPSISPCPEDCAAAARAALAVSLALGNFAPNIECFDSDASVGRETFNDVRSIAAVTPTAGVGAALLATSNRPLGLASTCVPPRVAEIGGGLTGGAPIAISLSPYSRLHDSAASSITGASVSISPRASLVRASSRLARVSYLLEVQSACSVIVSSTKDTYA